MDDFTKGMIAAVNGMLLDILAVVARKDYEDRRRRQAQGIATAKAEGAYKGRPANLDLHKRVSELLADGKSIRKVAELLKCSTTTVQKVKLNALEAAHEAFRKEYAILDEKIEQSHKPNGPDLTEADYQPWMDKKEALEKAGQLAQE